MNLVTINTSIFGTQHTFDLSLVSQNINSLLKQKAQYNKRNNRTELILNYHANWMIFLRSNEKLPVQLCLKSTHISKTIFIVETKDQQIILFLFAQQNQLNS